jgi:hypothetical protein
MTFLILFSCEKEISFDLDTPEDVLCLTNFNPDFFMIL